MSIIPAILSKIPGLSPRMKEFVSQAWQVTQGYQNSRQELMRAIAERNLKLSDLQRGLGYLQSGPVASILNMIAPGSAQKLYQLGTEICNAGNQQQPQQQQNNQGNTEQQSHRRENPFPSLKR